jgi:hypothetical protein
MKWTSLILTITVLGAGPAALADPPSPREETRRYTILVDGKAAGSCQMKAAEHADGTRCLAISADVRVKQFVFTYKYAFSGTEVWKNGFLTRIDCTADDNGKKTKVAGYLEGATFHLAVNGASSDKLPCNWTTIYAMAPPSAGGDAVIRLLDVDTGEVLTPRLEDLGASETKVGGRVVATRHYRWTGKEKVDLWYDARGVLQRLATVDDGHPTEWRITSNP